MQPIGSIPNEIWDEITANLHVKAKLSQTCSFFQPLCQPYLKITKSFFDIFDNLQSEYCEMEASCNALTYDEDKIINKIIYSRINPADLVITKISFYPSLITALPLLSRDLGVSLDNLMENCEKLTNVIQEGDFEAFEGAVKFIPIEGLKELASDENFHSPKVAEVALTLFDQIKQSDFVIIPELERIEECEDIEESLKSTCIGANTTQMDKPIYFIAKIQKINVIFRTEFCQKEILDAAAIVNAKLAKV